MQLFFKKTKPYSPIQNLADSLRLFIYNNTKEAEVRLSREILYLPNFSLTFEYEIFCIFLVEYCVAAKIKDPILKDMVLESFYSNWKIYFSDEQFRILKVKLDIYTQIIRKHEDRPTVIQNLGFAFSRNVLKNVDLSLASRVSKEYVPLKDAIEKIIDESKLDTSD